MRYVRFALVVGFLCGLAGAPALAQPTLTLVDWVPAGLRLTQGPTATLQYTIAGTTNICDLNWVRDDGFLVSVANVDPTSPPPFLVDLPLPTNVDRRTTTYIGTVRDTVTGEVAAGDRSISIIVDDVGPDLPNTTRPTFPYTSYSPTFTIDGNVNNNPPAGGNTDTPETAGSVIIYDTATGDTVGGGIIRTDSSFIASVDLSQLTSNVMHALSMHAIDEAGNLGTTRALQAMWTLPPPPTLTDLTITPPDGTLTRDPGVTVAGTVAGQVPPFTVNVYVDGFIQSQIAGLANGESFHHTLTLPGEGQHTVTVQATNSNVPPNTSLAVRLGTITLDRTAPAAPLITRPDPNVQPFITNANTFVLSGLSYERDLVTTDAYAPVILVNGPSGLTFSPASPLAIAADGTFTSTVNVTNMADGTYTITVAARDAAGNTGPTSQRQVVFTRDTSRPLVEQIRVDGVIAPQTSPEIYVGQRSVRVQIRVNEDMPTFPPSTLTQQGYSAVATGLSSSTLRLFEYIYGVIPGYDGPVTFSAQGGADRAGNQLSYSVSRLFIVDTVAPEVVSVEPNDYTSFCVSPSRIRVRFRDPLSAANTASGVDLAASVVTVTGPLEGSSGAVAGTSVPFDPVTLDFIPSAPLPAPGTYRVNITAVDKVGNRSTNVVRTFIYDTTPIQLNASTVRTNPPDGAYVNAATMPGTYLTPKCEAWIQDAQFDPARSKIRVRDYCRVPPDVPGTQSTTGPTNLTWTFLSSLAQNGSQDGVYTIELDVRDFAGNLSPTYITTYTYDTQLPSVSATFPATDQAVAGPLRIVDATFADRRVDFCRRNAGIDRQASTLELWLTRPNPYLNTYAAPRKIPGLLRFVSVGEVERVLLEVVNNQGVVTGLAIDGKDDGAYELRAQAVDRAANASPVTSVGFVYDTQRPSVAVDGNLLDGCTLTGPTFELTGTALDNRGGSGIGRVEVSLRRVDVNGFPTQDPPFIQRVQATLKPLGLGPYDPDPPRREWLFSGDVTTITTEARAELVVQSFDEAGNFADFRRIVRVLGQTLPPPVLSAPAQDWATSSQMVTFRWNRIEGAGGYRLRITTPDGNVVSKDLGRDEVASTVNLAAYTDGDGRYLWTVATRDAAGRYGAWAQNRVLIIDRGRPRVIAVDVFDPSPEAQGSINEGEVRFTLRFSEPMDPRWPLTVRVVPQRSSAIPALEVTPLSYQADTWVGRTVIPNGDLDNPDYNGLAVLTVTGGRDLGGSAMLEPQEGFTVFEIDTGPFFRTAMFVSPVNAKDVILLVKATTQRDGVAERVVEPLTVVVKRSGQLDQQPAMYRVAPSVFRGSFLLDNTLATDLDFVITGRDEQGNTSTRYLHLTVSRITSGEGGIVINQSRSMILAAGPGAVAQDQNLFLSATSAALVDGGGGEVASPAASLEGELVMVAALGAVEPQGLPLPGGIDLMVDLQKVCPADVPAPTLARAWLYRRDGDRWLPLAGSRAQGSLSGRLDRTGTLAVLADLVPPRVGGLPAEGLVLATSRPSLELPVQEAGSGVAPASVKVLIDGVAQAATWDAARAVVTVQPAKALAEGRHSVDVTVADLAGNVARATAALLAPAAPGFTSAVAYPNPARQSAWVRYQLSQPADRVTLSIHDAAGARLVTREGSTSAGSPQVIEWDLTNGRGRSVANGVYVGRLTAHGASGKRREDLKIAVLR